MRATLPATIVLTIFGIITGASTAAEELSCKSVLSELPADIQEWYAHKDPISSAVVLSVKTLQAISSTTSYGNAPGYKCAAVVKLQHVTGAPSQVTVIFTVFTLGPAYIHGIEEID